MRARENYVKNVARIYAHNENKSSSYVQGENHMTDLSYEEVVKLRTGHRRRRSHVASRGIHRVHEATEAAKGKKKQTKQTKPTKHGKASKVKLTSSVGSLDLRSDFPPIQYQGECGSCWSFTATALVDNYSFKLGHKTKYSEQYMLDCSGSGK